MSFVTLSFRIHIPIRLRKYAPLDVEKSHSYFDDEAMALQIDEMATLCFLPATALLLKLVKRHKGAFKVAFSVSGITMELLEKYRPDVLHLLRKIFHTGYADIYAETYYHSLASLYSNEEFLAQIKLHSSKAEELFGIKPAVLCNTELIHDNKLVATVKQLGLKGILCEGVNRLLKDNNPNKLYAAPGIDSIGLLLRNYRLSDDIAFHYGKDNWEEHPLTAAKFASWIHKQTEKANVVNLFLDYITFGVHKKKESGIFQFLDELPQAVINEQWQFETPSAVLNRLSDVSIYDASKPTSWKDNAGASCVWCENMMQNNMLNKIYKLEQLVNAIGNAKMKEVWRRLQCADYFFHMSAIHNDDIQSHINPFCTNEEAYRNYYNIITDFEIQLIRKDLEEFRIKRSLFTTLIF